MADIIEERLAEVLEENKKLRFNLRNIIEWLDDGIRQLSDSCQADVDAARKILNRSK
jgi:hypothetical protein